MMRDPCKSLFCGPETLSLGQLFGKTSVSNVFNRFDGAEVIYTHKARVAIKLALSFLGIRQNDKVLVPSYNCGTEIDALLSGGVCIEPYRVERTGEIDFEDLYGRLDDKTKAVYVTHYFGFVQDVGRIRDVCLEKGFYLMEDCALSLLSSLSDGSPIGSRGDIALYNFPKTVPVPDGGALVLNRSDISLSDIDWKKPSVSKIFREVLPFVKRGVLRCVSGTFAFPGFWWILRKPYLSGSGIEKYPDIPQDYYYDNGLDNTRMSGVTKCILPRFDVEEIIASRRRNYQSYIDDLVGLEGIEILYEKSGDGICPLSFPVLVERRHEICERLNAFSIDAMEWWSGYHRDFPWDRFPDACYLKDHLLVLPVHQQLRERHIKYICEKLKKIVKSVII